MRGRTIVENAAGGAAGIILIVIFAVADWLHEIAVFLAPFAIVGVIPAQLVALRRDLRRTREPPAPPAPAGDPVPPQPDGPLLVAER
jgi:hypothetical protein